MKRHFNPSRQRGVAKGIGPYHTQQLERHILVNRDFPTRGFFNDLFIFSMYYKE